MCSLFWCFPGVKKGPVFSFEKGHTATPIIKNFLLQQIKEEEEKVYSQLSPLVVQLRNLDVHFFSKTIYNLNINYMNWTLKLK